MKVLIVSASDRAKGQLAYHLKPVGFEIVHYNDPVKAIDNLEELNPELILFQTGDFPRHWKPFLKLLREKKSKEEAVFIIMAGEEFPFEEAAKAAHLGANGIVGTDLDKKEVQRLEELLRRYRSVKDKRKFHRLVPTQRDRLGFMLTHPLSLTIVTGRLSDISIQGASFIPTHPALTKDLKKGEEIPACSLRVGQEVISVLCRVTRNRQDIGLQFRSFETGGHHKLFNYIQSHSERELKGALSRSAETEPAGP